MKKLIAIVFLLISLSYSKDKISIANILKSSFSEDIRIEKKKFTLSNKEVKSIQKTAKAKLRLRAVHIFEVKENNTTVGNAVLIKQRIRTRNANILYITDANDKIKSIEVLSFGEAEEYRPNKKWQKMLEGKSREDELTVGEDLALITGATMSVKSLASATRIALAILAIKD